MKVSKLEIVSFLVLCFGGYLTILRPGYLCIKGPTPLLRDARPLDTINNLGYKNEIIGMLDSKQIFEYIDVESGKGRPMYKGWHKGGFVYVQMNGNFEERADLHILWPNKRICD